jgi:hypothetical protein
MADQMIATVKTNLTKFFMMPADMANIKARAASIQQVASNPTVRGEAAQVQNEILRLQGEHGTLTSKVMNVVAMLGKIGIKMPGQDPNIQLGQMPRGGMAEYMRRLRSVPPPAARSRALVRYRGGTTSLIRPERGRQPVYARSLRQAFQRSPRFARPPMWLQPRMDQQLGVVPLVALAAIAIPAAAVVLGIMGLFKNVQRQKETLQLLERGLTPAEIEQVRRSSPLIDVGVKGLMPLLLIGGAAFLFGPRLMKAARARA